MKIEVHLLGIWLTTMIIHTLIVERFGENFVHFPMYFGLLVSMIIFVRRKWTALPTEVSSVFFCMLVLMMLSGITGIDPSHSNDTVKLYVKGMLLAVLIGGVIKNNKQIETITLYCLLGIIFGVYEAYRQHITGDYEINQYGVSTGSRSKRRS